MPERDIQLYLVDILDSCNAVTEYVAGITFEDFCNERKTYSAVIDFQIINYTRIEGEIRVRRTERYAVEDFD